MGLLKLLYCLTLVSIGVVAKHADLDVYWKSKLPDTPMPKALRDLVHNGKFLGSGGFSVRPDIPSKSKDQLHNHRTKVSPFILNRYVDYTPSKAPLQDYQKVSAFFLKKDLHRGSTMDMQFVESVKSKTVFLPRQVADSIPFSSKSIPEILNKFSVNPHSAQAEAIKDSIAECEVPAMKGEDKKCATSLESMVNFATSKLGKNLLAVSNEAPKADAKIQKYVIVVVSKLTDKTATLDDKFVACHKQKYAYAVFYCHALQHTDAYMVNLVGADGAKVKAVVVCHEDTSLWDPNHLAFQLLKVKPGTGPICHFIPGDHIVWVPKH